MQNFIARYRSLKEKILPLGTSRRLLFDLISKSFRIMFSEGPRGVMIRFQNILMRSTLIPVNRVDNGEYKNGKYENAYKNMLKVAYGQNSAEFVPFAQEAESTRRNSLRIIAFYLPQFHPIPENDVWWGKGFTEWKNVSRAIPQFVGHHQPHLPGELGFYDLRVPEVLRRQVQLARNYGISGFCFYYYWFDGKRLLERPLEQLMTDAEIDFPFCICWANENWTRRWDGREDDVLIAQNHSEESDYAFIRDIEPILRHENYICINGHPVILVYRTQLLPDPVGTARRWKEYCQGVGIQEPYLITAQVFEPIDPRPIGFDAAVEFPPNTPMPLPDISRWLTILNPDYRGNVYRYSDIAREMSKRPRPPYQLFKSVFPAWDNTPRRLGRGTIFAYTSPNLYRKWLTEVCRHTLEEQEGESQLVFINAWNEWGEGAYLEPDRYFGYAYLQATADALASLHLGNVSVTRKNWTILFLSHDASRAGAQSVLINTIEWFCKYTSIRIKVLCLEGGEWLYRFQGLADTIILSQLEELTEDDNGLLEQLVKFCDGNPDLIYGNSIAIGRFYNFLNQLGSPIITHVHEMEMSIARYGGQWMDATIINSSHFIACSEAVQKNLIDNWHIAPEKISVVYSSIVPQPSIQPTFGNQRTKKRLRKKLGLKQEGNLVIGCGLGMPFRKGADLFIDVARILRDKNVRDFHLYWVGGFSDYEQGASEVSWSEVMRLLDQEGLKDFVTFLGLRNNPKDYFLAGDVFILPSREDPFPLVALEAAECGLPIVCFDNAGGMPDFVEDDAGFVVPFEDVEAMTDCVIQLFNNENLRQRLGIRAREKLLEGFTAERTSPHILSVCRKIADKKPTISVIVPNYNHADYLPQRLESIFNQSFRDFEVILLDDASSDNSIEILNEYMQLADVQLIRNKVNSGSPFKQWLNGLEVSQAEIIWIAESDDVSAPHFLETLLPAFKDSGVKLAYANSHVIDAQGNIIGSYTDTEYLTSLSAAKWNNNYLVYADQEINDGLGIKNTILNISSALFRRFELTHLFKETLSNMRIAGDWFFEVNAILGGKIYYDATKLNYHRRHSASVIGRTVSDSKIQDFFREFYEVQCYIFENYRLFSEFENRWERYLQTVWQEFTSKTDFEDLSKYYPVAQARKKILKNISSNEI